MSDKPKIILAVTGSIAAYKSALLVRLLIKNSYEVKVIMTNAAKDFITPLTLSTLSTHPVHSDISNGNEWNSHVDLGLWADAFLVAPATANTIGKMAHGITDNIVMATYLSAKCPVYIAPAMDLDMWLHPTTVNNIKLLESYGVSMIDAEFGELASGLVGKGRMAEPETILAYLNNVLRKNKDLQGEKVLITAGPTYENIDPVRYIGNRSTGRMGIALAYNAAKRGANVVLIIGPTNLTISHPNIEVISIRTAEEMFQASKDHFDNTDIAILAAAVADYTPKNYSDKKIKKADHELSLSLKRTTDIAKTLGKTKRTDQLLIGFALETNNEVANAKAKIKKKNFDFIVLNSLNDKGAGFAHQTNKISIIHNDGTIKNFDLKSKTEVANDIMNEVVSIM